MLKHIINRIRSHKKAVSAYQSDQLSSTDFEITLLEEIEVLQQEDFEKKLSEEIIAQEEKLFVVFIKVKEAAVKKNIDKNALQNMILSELNRSMIDDYLL